MALVHHQATATPSKVEIIARWLDAHPWGGDGDVQMVGGYRFDDPAGQVGVEGLLVIRAGRVLHVPMTYRAAPLEHGEAHLMGTMEHSALGQRWVYEAHGDPVAQQCFVRALAGEQQQAEVEVWDGDRFVEHREPVVRVTLEEGAAEGSAEGAAEGAAEGVSVAQVDGVELRMVHVLEPSGGSGLPGVRRLVATWPGGRGVVAAM